MRRLAMVALLVGMIATAQWTLEPPSRAADRPAGAGGATSTAVDRARLAIPLPRTAMPPVPDEAAEARRRQVERDAARAARARATPVRAPGDVWAALARCESGSNPGARSGNGRYHGAFQFSAATWQSLGYGGLPTDHSYEVQLQAAQRLQARSGWGQWPRCSRRLGLR